MATEKWYVNDNFVSKKLNGDDVAAECDSHETALEIAAAHNLKDVTKKMVEQKADAALDRAAQKSKIDLFLRELQATDTDDYNVIRNRVAAIVEELEMEAAELTVFDIYKLCSQIDEDIEGQYEDDDEPHNAGLVVGQDNCIFVLRDDFTSSWKILRTKEKSSMASVMFLVETEGQALVAGQKIAEAIGGKFFGKTDPRK